MNSYKMSVASLLLLGLMPLQLRADTFNFSAPVEADTYFLRTMSTNGYPEYQCARATDFVGAEVLFRFDLSVLDGLLADDIVSATFNVYTGEGTGPMATPVAPVGTYQRADITALDAWDPQTHPGGLTYWTESLQVNSGLIVASTDPGDVDPGLGLEKLLLHSDGPNSWATVDLTAFVKAWMPGGNVDILNNGIRIVDRPDDYGWYFFTKDVGGSVGGGHPSHPGAAYIPQLEVITSRTPPTPFILPGDANGDHVVNAVDATILATNWLTATGATWGMGDFNADGAVDAADATILATNWQSGASGVATVPEPSMLAMLLGTLVLAAVLRLKLS